MSIKASLNKGLSLELTQSFSNILPVDRPVVETREIRDPEWLVGFICAEGCFSVDVFKSKTHKIGSQVQLRFSITQHSRDTLLMNSFIQYLNCGRVKKHKNKNFVEFVVVKFSDIDKNILPLLQKYPLQGVKSLDYADFCQVAGLMRDNAHLISEGLGQIINIKNGMNRGRKWNHD